MSQVRNYKTCRSMDGATQIALLSMLSGLCNRLFTLLVSVTLFRPLNARTTLRLAGKRSNIAFHYIVTLYSSPQTANKAWKNFKLLLKDHLLTCDGTLESPSSNYRPAQVHLLVIHKRISPAQYVLLVTCNMGYPIGFWESRRNP